MNDLSLNDRAMALINEFREQKSFANISELCQVLNGYIREYTGNYKTFELQDLVLNQKSKYHLLCNLSSKK